MNYPSWMFDRVLNTPLLFNLNPNECSLVPFVQSKKLKKHQWKSVTFGKVASFSSKFLDSCFSRFLNCINGIKSQAKLVKWSVLFHSEISAFSSNRAMNFNTTFSIGVKNFRLKATNNFQNHKTYCENLSVTPKKCNILQTRANFICKTYLASHIAINNFVIGKYDKRVKNIK